jgi:hypothetical protein
MLDVDWRVKQMDLEGIECYGIEFLQLSDLWEDKGVEFADVEDISAFVL